MPCVCGVVVRVGGAGVRRYCRGILTSCRAMPVRGSMYSMEPPGSCQWDSTCFSRPSGAAAQEACCTNLSHGATAADWLRASSQMRPEAPLNHCRSTVDGW